MSHAFLWRKGVMTDLGTLHDDPCSTSESINSRGQVVGASQAGCRFFTTAFLWDHGAMVDLNTLVPPNSPLRLTGAFWINDRGEITGRGVPPGCGDVDICGHAFLLIPCERDHDVTGECTELDQNATGATANSSVTSEQTATRTRPASLSPSEIMSAWRARLARRYHIPALGAPRD